MTLDERLYVLYSEPVTEMTPALRQQPGVRSEPYEEVRDMAHDSHPGQPLHDRGA